MTTKKYKDTPRHKCTIEYESTFKSDFKRTVNKALKEMEARMLEIIIVK